jgi:hypothetical protein
MKNNKLILNNIYFFENYFLSISWGLGIGDWGLGIGDWGLGIGDWAQALIANRQCPIPHPHININNLKNI